MTLPRVQGRSLSQFRYWLIWIPAEASSSSAANLPFAFLMMNAKGGCIEADAMQLEQ